MTYDDSNSRLIKPGEIKQDGDRISWRALDIPDADNWDETSAAGFPVEEGEIVRRPLPAYRDLEPNVDRLQLGDVTRNGHPIQRWLFGTLVESAGFKRPLPARGVVAQPNPSSGVHIAGAGHPQIGPQLINDGSDTTVRYTEQSQSAVSPTAEPPANTRETSWIDFKERLLRYFSTRNGAPSFSEAQEWHSSVFKQGFACGATRSATETFKPNPSQTFQQEQWEWVKKTFPGETADGVLKHLQEELNELSTTSNDPKEMADVFLLLQCLASHHGVDLIEAAKAKFDECKSRKWKLVEGVGWRSDKPTVELLETQIQQAAERATNSSQAGTPRTAKHFADRSDWQADKEFADQLETELNEAKENIAHKTTHIFNLCAQKEDLSRKLTTSEQSREAMREILTEPTYVIHEGQSFRALYTKKDQNRIDSAIAAPISTEWVRKSELDDIVSAFKESEQQRDQLREEIVKWKTKWRDDYQKWCDKDNEAGKQISRLIDNAVRLRETNERLMKERSDLANHVLVEDARHDQLLAAERDRDSLRQQLDEASKELGWWNCQCHGKTEHECKCGAATHFVKYKSVHDSLARKVEAQLAELSTLKSALNQAEEALEAWQQFPHAITAHCLECSAVFKNAASKTDEALARLREVK